MPDFQDHYAVLNVSSSAKAPEIRTAARKLYFTSHPDRGGDADKFHAVRTAQDILCNPASRAEFDAERSAYKVKRREKRGSSTAAVHGGSSSKTAGEKKTEKTENSSKREKSDKKK